MRKTGVLGCVIKKVSDRCGILYVVNSGGNRVASQVNVTEGREEDLALNWF